MSQKTPHGKLISISNSYGTNRCPPKTLLPNKSMLYKDVSTGMCYWDADEIKFNDEFITEIKMKEGFTEGDSKMVWFRPDPKSVRELIPEEGTWIFVQLMKGKRNKNNNPIHTAFLFTIGTEREYGNANKQTEWALLTQIKEVVPDVTSLSPRTSLPHSPVDPVHH